jgi:two-component system, chemotaxis family, response regulator Rcp1
MGGTAELLLVEDNDGDARLTREALKSGRLWTHLNVVRDGAEAMAYLRREGKFSAATRPNLILLDLNLPRKDGREVLREIKSDEDLKRIPVVVVTTSTAEEDIHLAYGEHANCYIPKPETLNEFLAVVEAIEHFWLAIVRLPSS